LVGAPVAAKGNAKERRSRGESQLDSGLDSGVSGDPPAPGPEEAQPARVYDRRPVAAVTANERCRNSLVLIPTAGGGGGPAMHRNGNDESGEEEEEEEDFFNDSCDPVGILQLTAVEKGAAGSKQPLPPPPLKSILKKARNDDETELWPEYNDDGSSFTRSVENSRYRYRYIPYCTVYR
jgi:hypothetical protein